MTEVWSPGSREWVGHIWGYDFGSDFIVHLFFVFLIFNFYFSCLHMYLSMCVGMQYIFMIYSCNVQVHTYAFLSLKIK